MKDEERLRRLQNVDIARSSAVMAAGTLISRILGFVRMALLLVVVGATGGGAADAFQVANNLPNQIYNLLASGVLSAILVPEIVRAVRRKNSDEFVNRLLTMAGAILLVVTLVAVALASILVAIFANQMDPQWRALAVVFAIWCLPQIFFYGLYSLYGQVLNACGSFGPYMWAPVLNNVIGIAGLLAFWMVFGPASTTASDPASWTTPRIALLAGVATLGVAAQALVLLIPMRRTGFHIRLVWGLRGSGLRQASNLAGWAFAALAVGQIGFLIVSNVAAAAAGVETAQHLGIATTIHRNTAFMIYQVPHSIVSTSILTAMFTRLSAHASAGDFLAVRRDYSKALRIIGIISIFFSALLIVAALPVAQLLLPSRPVPNLIPYAQVLMAFSLGIMPLGLWGVTHRVFFALEDARGAFFTQLLIPIVIAITAGLAIGVGTPAWWVPLTAVGESLGWVSCVVMGYLILRRKLPEPDTGVVVSSLGRALVAVLPASLAGWAILHFWGAAATSEAVVGRLGGAVARCTVVGVVMLGLYYLGLRLLRVQEVQVVQRLVSRKVSRRRNG